MRCSPLHATRPGPSNVGRGVVMHRKGTDSVNVLLGIGAEGLNWRDGAKRGLDYGSRCCETTLMGWSQTTCWLKAAWTWTWGYGGRGRMVHVGGVELVSECRASALRRTPREGRRLLGDGRGEDVSWRGSLHFEVKSLANARIL